MSDGVQIRGVVGQITWSYYVAAGLHGYSVRRDRKTGLWHLVGTIVVSDAFKMKQRPLIFVAPTQKRAFKWMIEKMDIERDTVRATLSLLKE